MDSTEPRRAPSPIRRVERTPPVQLPLHTLRIDKLDADLLLPAAAETPASTFALYRDRLATEAIFSPRGNRLLRALETGMSESPPFDPDQPVVGIILNQPLAFPGGGGVRELCREMRELGCRVVLIPPCADLLMPADPVGRVAGIRSMLQRLDALIGPGGQDIDPSIYGEDNHHAERTNMRRDRFEADFALMAKSEPIFMFGICRSHQLWNAADEGALVQDVEKEGRSPVSLRQKGHAIPMNQPFVLRDEAGNVTFEYRVRLNPESRMAEVTKELEFVTNANHHQAVDRAGSDLEIVGRLKDHPIAEATERWNTFTVQWHPEAMSNDPIQSRLLSTVARRAGLFRAAKRLSEQKQQPVTAQSIEAWHQARFDPLDVSDLRWIRRDLIPHWYGIERSYAAGGVDRR